MWLNRTDGRSPTRPDRVLRSLRGAAQRCRSGGEHSRGMGGRSQRRRGGPRGERHLRRPPKRRARVHEVDDRPISAARGGRAAAPRASFGHVIPSAVAESAAGRHAPRWRSGRDAGGRGAPLSMSSACSRPIPVSTRLSTVSSIERRCPAGIGASSGVPVAMSEL